MTTQNSPKPLGFPSLVADINRMYTAILYRQAKAEGVELTHAQWRVMVLLLRKDGPTQSELAERLLIEKAPLGTLLDKMEANGLIERRADPNDRRVKRVYLQPHALPLLPSLEQTAKKLKAQMTEGLSADEVELVTLLLSRIHTNLRLIREQS